MSDDTAQIRKKLHQLIDKADERFIKMVYALAEEYEMDEFELSAEHKEILNQRLASHKSDPNTGSSWKKVKSRIRKQL